MKALTVMQPWATLIACGIKTIETRPAPPNGDMRPDGVRGLPGLAISRGERVAIHAGSRRPISAPGWTAFHGGSEHYLRPEGRFRYLDQPIPLPLGAVVATAVVADALPIVDAHLGWSGGPDTPDRAVLLDDDLHSLTLLDGVDYWGELNEHDITDQLPLGDFTPGRWGWILTDVEPLPEPIPARGKQGVWEWTP